MHVNDKLSVTEEPVIVLLYLLFQFSFLCEFERQLQVKYGLYKR
jgi:hypothetical protein